MSQVKVPTVFTAVDRMSRTMQVMGRSVTGFAARAEVAMARASRATAMANRRFNALTSSIFNLRNAAAIGIAALGVKKMLDMATATAKAGDEIAKTSRQIGITAEALQEFRFASDRQGVSSEVLTKSFQLLNRNIGDVQLGQGTLTTILKRTNPALLEQLKQVDNNAEAFELISGAISSMPNQLQRAALAQAAFGRSGQDMLKLLEAGPDGIAALREEARKYGGVMSNEAAVASEKFVDAQTNMQFAMQGLRMMLGVQLMPVIQGYVERITDAVVANKELIGVKIGQFVDKLSQSVAWLVDNWAQVWRIIKIVTIAFVGMKAAILASQAAIAIAQGGLLLYKGVLMAVTVATQVWGMVTSLAAIGALAPILLIVAAFGLLVAVIVSVGRNWGRIVESFRNNGILGGIKMIGAALLDTVLAPLQAILKLASRIVPKRLGGGALANASQSVEELRVRMGVREPGEQAQAVNAPAERQEAMVSRLEETRNNNVVFDFKNVPKGLQVSENGQPSAIPNLTSSFAL